MSSCFFIGHRETSIEILPALTDIIERHITQYGVTKFLVGKYGGFDQMATQAVLEAKRHHSDIKLIQLTPYPPNRQFEFISYEYDGIFYPEFLQKIPQHYAIVEANRFAVEHVDYLISHVWHAESNAWKLVEYAKGLRHDIHITNIPKVMD